MLEPQQEELCSQILPRWCIDLVDGKRDRFPKPPEHSSEFPISARDLGSAVNYIDDVVGVFQREASLPQDLGGDQVLVIRDDSAGVDDFEVLLTVRGLTVNAIPGDSRLVSDYRPALSRDCVEQRGLADVRSAHYHNGGQWAIFRHLSTMIAWTQYTEPYLCPALPS